MIEPKAVILLHERDTGHRLEYLQLFRNLIEGAGAKAIQRGLRFSDIFRKEAIFSTMLEEHTWRFFWVAAFRSLLGRRSLTLIFRVADPAKGRAPKFVVKRMLLSYLRRARWVTVMAILPLHLDPRFGRIAKDWIYDPQLWDAGDVGTLPAPPAEVVERARGRRIICALGSQTRDKGFDQFCKVWLASEELRSTCLFVAAGRIAGDLAGDAARFEEAGGMVMNRLIDDNELLALYNASEMVWCCYSPEYDQASGIFGRAAQFGRRAIVREGSYLELLSGELGIPSLPLAWDAKQAASQIVLSNPVTAVPIDSTQLRAISVARLGAALGLAMG